MMATKEAGGSWDTPSIPASEANLVVHSTTRIAAPASLVFRTLRNTDTWKDWCWFVPKVVITYQPPEEDTSTAVEIHELVRNTSIAGSFDSELTDGLVGASGAGGAKKDQTPPNLPPLKLRSKSDASAFSVPRSNSEASNHVPPTTPPRSGSISKQQNGLSAAQKYAAAQTARRSSVQAGEDLPPVEGNTLQVDPFLSPPSAAYSSSPSQRRKSRDSGREAAIAKAQERSALAALALYGEPSVRVQLGTKMTFFVRMDPKKPSEYKHAQIQVTEVSRPDDPISEGTGLTHLTRTKTHTLARNNVYRIVWVTDTSRVSLSSMKSGSAMPKFLLQGERVHEIRPITLGDGSEQCEYRTWECQRGPVAKVVKKKYGDYLQSMFEKWGAGLGQFCEGMGGKVDRRDFIEVGGKDAATAGGNGFQEVTVFSTAALG